LKSDIGYPSPANFRLVLCGQVDFEIHTPLIPVGCGAHQRQIAHGVVSLVAAGTAGDSMGQFNLAIIREFVSAGSAWYALAQQGVFPPT
jgi:hypothetical protein